jgi:hypothetical protein
MPHSAKKSILLVVLMIDDQSLDQATILIIIFPTICVFGRLGFDE